MALTLSDKIRLRDLERLKLIEKARAGSLLAFTALTKPDYKPSWHHRVVCKYLDRFAKGEITRLIVSMPPRHGKSELVSRRLPAFLLGQNPNLSIIAASYSADLSSLMNRDVQRIIDSPEYREIFPNTRLEGANVRTVADGKALRNSDMFEIVGFRGIYRSSGVGGGITGMGASYAIVDDPVKNQEEADSPTYRQKIWDWYTSTLFTRLEQPGSVLVTLTRWHEDDLSGRLLDLMEKDQRADRWTVLKFPALAEPFGQHPDDPREEGEALWPREFPVKRLNSIRASVGSRVWQSLYQQSPSAREGSILKRSWLQFYRQSPERIDQHVMVWDMSFKSGQSTDFVVGQIWGVQGAKRYLLDQVRGRMSFTETLNAVRSLSSKWPQVFTKLIEDTANGPAIIDSLKSQIPGIIPFKPKDSKQARLQAVAPDFEAGNVFLPDPTIAQWIHEYVEELMVFPNATHDDQVDCTSAALLHFRKNGDWLSALNRM